MPKENKTEQEDRMSRDMLESYLIKSEQEVKQLKKVIEDYKQREVTIRDNIAVSCFAQHFTTTPSYETAAEDSYKAADAFMRVRDHGKSYETEIVEDIKFLIENQPNDADLGAKLREIYK